MAGSKCLVLRLLQHLLTRQLDVRIVDYGMSLLWSMRDIAIGSPNVDMRLKVIILLPGRFWIDVWTLGVVISMDMTVAVGSSSCVLQIFEKSYVR